MPHATHALAPQATPGGYPLAAASFLGTFGAGTRRAYTQDLDAFTRWCDAQRLDPLGVRRPHLELYARHLEAQGYAPRTRHRRLSTLRSFYRYAELDEYVTSNPAAHVRMPVIDDETRTQGLSRPELSDLLAAAEASGKPNDRVLVHLLGLNGLRISEALGIDVDDLGHERGFHVVRVLRKGGRHELIPLAPPTSWAVTQLVGARTAGPLLTTRTGARLERSGATRRLRLLYRDAGIGKRAHPHALRHTFVTLSLDAGVSPRDVQHSAGHKDMRSTALYDRRRASLSRNSTHVLAAFVAGAA